MIVCYELWLYSLSSNHEKWGAHCELFMHSVKNKEGALKLATDHGDVWNWINSIISGWESGISKWSDIKDKNAVNIE